ncbi:MAG: ABC transporter ATP-binding protein [Candidatus Omnitrophota bacterium]
MENNIIEIKGVSKRYKIGRGDRYLALRDKLTYFMNPLNMFRKGKRKSPGEEFYALKDVNLNVRKGEIVGIIGRNGAGKTTLLKIISRITYPSGGEIKIYGRVASLLEVGTGFHPELTGRENVYFNGSILGMKKSEITRKFDEIVAFAEVEKFIDMPVKRYSSGMQVRLAFAVAAHLEPEILLIDEVLSVGDITFQKKSLGKMENVAREGRTVLFVSHNMGAVQRLCNRAVLLNNGLVVEDGDVNEVTEKYMSYGLNKAGERIWSEENSPGDDVVRLRRICVMNAKGEIKVEFNTHEGIFVSVEYAVLKNNYPLNTLLYFLDEEGITKFVSMDNLDSPWKDTVRPAGLYRCTCEVPPDLLNEGTIRINVIVTTSPYNLHARDSDVLVFKVIDDMSNSGVRGNYPREWPAAVVRPRLNWKVEMLNHGKG